MRPAVLWRKSSFGSDSEAGSRIAERVLTVVASCRQQGRPLLDLLVAACEVALRGSPPSSLLPALQVGCSIAGSEEGRGMREQPCILMEVVLGDPDVVEAKGVEKRDLRVHPPVVLGPAAIQLWQVGRKVMGAKPYPPCPRTDVGRNSPRGLRQNPRRPMTGYRLEGAAASYRLRRRRIAARRKSSASVVSGAKPGTAPIYSGRSTHQVLSVVSAGPGGCLSHQKLR